MDNKERLEKLFEVLKFAKEEELGADEIFQELNNQEVILKPQVIERLIEKPMKTTPEKREYMKAYRYHLKQVEKTKEIEAKKQLKVSNALLRKKARCFYCNKVVEVVNPTYEIEKQKKGEDKIIILAKCPLCSKVTRSFGGFYN